MPRDIAGELVQLKQGLHQFIMQMYVILDKIVEESEAKSQIVRVLLDEVNYIKNSDDNLKDTQHFIDQLKEHRRALTASINKEHDESKRFDMMQAYQGLDTFIKYIDE